MGMAAPVYVPVYWVVDGDARQVEAWTTGTSFPTIVQDRLAWQPAAAATPFTLELAQLFRPL